MPNSGARTAVGAEEHNCTGINRMIKASGNHALNVSETGLFVGLQITVGKIYISFGQ